MALTRVTNNGLDPNDEFSFNGLNVTGVVTATSGVGTIILDPAGNMLKLGNATMHRDSTTGDTIIMNNTGAYNPLRASKYLINTNTVIDSSRNINAGVVTATTLYGDGSNLTGISAGYWVAGGSGIHTTSNVGIGTDNPEALLDVQGILEIGNLTDISPDATGSGQLRIDANGYNPYIAADATAMHIGHNSSVRDLRLQTNETDRLTIDGSTGNIGIGITIPTARLHVAGGQVSIANTTNINFTGAANGSTTSVLKLDNDNSSNGDNLRTRIEFRRSGNSGTQVYTALDSVRTGTHDTDFVISNNYGASLNEHLRINSSGIVTKPYQPSFYVSGAFTLTSWNGHQHAVWSDSTTPPLFDTNNDYANGVFTAPVDGKYYFSASILSGASAGYLLWAFWKNTSQYMSGWFEVYDDSIDAANECQLTGSILMDLSANDTVRVALHNSYTNAYLLGYNYFLGYLVG